VRARGVRVRASRLMRGVTVRGRATMLGTCALRPSDPARAAGARVLDREAVDDA
jgi:hypothetical protein